MGMIEELNSRSEGALPGRSGLEIGGAARGSTSSGLELREELLAPNGYLHAATVVALADTSCGYGTFVSLPEGGSGFTTRELKSNFRGPGRQGSIDCEARLVHGGRNTQVWDATVMGGEKTIAALRCTQMIPHPPSRHRQR